MAKDHPSRKLAVILHADVVGSTTLVQQNETLTHERIQASFQRFSETIKDYGGIAHELRGDALVAEFERASDAVAAALSYQDANAEFNTTFDDDIRPQLRIGISLGEVVIADNTITGAGVVLAQRLEQLAESGGVCIQSAAYETVPQRLPFEYTSLGEQQVKGFEESVRAYAVTLKSGEKIPEPEPSATSLSAHPERAQNSRFAIGAAFLLVIVGILLAWWQPWVTREEPASIEQMAFPLPDKPSIAVLAFDNLSQNANQESLNDAIVDNIITELSRFSELFVIARNSSFTYKGKPVKVQQVAEELGVRYVLEGSLQRSSDRVRITVQLIDALTGNHVWAQVYDRELEDIFEIQDEIARTVASTVEEKVEVRERHRVATAHPASLEAFEYWMRGTKYWFEWNEEGNDKAQVMYKKAVELDPNMVRGHLGLAWVYINGFAHGWTELSRVESLERARELALKGLELAPHDYFSHQTMGYVHIQAGEREQAIAKFERALELNPNAGYPMMDLGEALVYDGRPQEGIAWFQKAMRLNPHHPDWFYWNLAKAEYAAGQYKEAVATMNKMNAIPNRARHILAAAYVQLGKLEEARALVKAILEINPEYSLEKLRLYFASKYKDVAIPERYIEDMRKAGLPE